MPFDSTPITNPTIESLEKVYDLLKAPKAWTTGEYARNHRGIVVSPYDETAASFCLVGAVEKVTGAKLNETIYHALGFMGSASRAINWNDYVARHEDVLRRIQLSITKEKEKMMASL